MHRRIVAGRFLDMLPPMANLVDRAQIGGVTWMSPSAGDIYKSGDSVVGQWTSEDSFSSPSFSLCTSGSSDENERCGSSVWPILEKNGESNMVHLYDWSLYLLSGTYECRYHPPYRSLPTTPSAATFYLRMSNAETGKNASSPSFSLARKWPFIACEIH